MNKNITRYIPIAAFVIVLAGAYQITTIVDGEINGIRVKVAPNAPESTASFDVKDWLKNLAPVLVENRNEKKEGTAANSLDSIFASTEKPQKNTETYVAPRPNYAKLLKTAMQVDSIGKDGAFINGKFYSINEPIYDFEYPEEGRSIIPTITKVNSNSVLVTHGGTITELTI